MDLTSSLLAYDEVLADAKREGREPNTADRIHAMRAAIEAYEEDRKRLAPEASVDSKDRRILFLEGLVRAYGPTSLQYDIEHPNDGLNSSGPAVFESEITRRFRAQGGDPKDAKG